MSTESDLSVYVTFWDTGYGREDEWMLSVRCPVPDRQTFTTFSYSIVLVPGTNRWIEAHRTPGDPLTDGASSSSITSSSSSGKPRKLMGAVMLKNTEIMEHLSLEVFDSFIKDSEEAMADNPVPDRECNPLLSDPSFRHHTILYNPIDNLPYSSTGITDWGPELWTTARVAQLAMAEWISLSPAAATEFDFEFHNYARLRDRIAARKIILQTQSLEKGLVGWDNVVKLEE